MSLREEVAKGAAWSATQSWGGQAISLVIFLALTRLLRPDMFGLVALAGVFITFLQVFVDQGLVVALIQRRELEPQHLDSAFWINLAAGLLLTTISVASAGAIAAFLGDPRLAGVIRWLSASLVISAFSRVPEALLRRAMAFRKLAIRSLVAASIGGIAGVVAALAGFGVWSLVVQQLSTRFVEVLVLWRVSHWRPKLSFSSRHAGDLLSFGVNVSGKNLLDFATHHSDDFLIGYFLGPVALGYYYVAYRFLRIMINLLGHTVSSVALPAFSRLQTETERLRRGFYAASQMFSFVAFPAFLGTIAVAPYLVRAAFGSRWLPSVPVMQVLALIGIWQMIIFATSAVITAKGKPSWVLGLTMLRAITSVAAFAIAVRWGIVAVAVSLVIASYLLAPLYVRAVVRLIDIELKTYLRGFFGPATASLVMIAAVFGAIRLTGDALDPLPALLLYVTLGVLIYAVAIWAVAPGVVRQAVGYARLALPGARSKDAVGHQPSGQN